MPVSERDYMQDPHEADTEELPPVADTEELPRVEPTPTRQFAVWRFVGFVACCILAVVWEDGLAAILGTVWALFLIGGVVYLTARLVRWYFFPVQQ